MHGENTFQREIDFKMGFAFLKCVFFPKVTSKDLNTNKVM